MKISKDSNSRADDHIYDELDLYSKLNEKNVTSVKFPSPKDDKVIFDDRKGIEPPGYQPLAEPRYQSCSATSIAKSNHSNDYYIEEDVRSIKDEDCQFTSEKAIEEHEEKITEQYEEKTIEQREENSKEQEPYSKLHHFK